MRVWDTFVVGHQQLRPGGAVRRRQRHRGRRGRGRRAVQLALRAAGVRARLPAGSVLRDRVIGPEHGRSQHPDSLRRGDAGAGHGRGRARAGPEPAAGVHRLLQRPRRAAGDERPDRDLVPQLRHDAVRRARAHRDAGRHRLGRDRAGFRRRRAGEVVRAPGGHGAGAERDQAADHLDRRGRRRREHRRPRRARPGAAGLGPALRLRPARPRPRARAHRRGQDPAAGADHLARVVRAAEREPAGDRRHRGARVGEARGGLHVQAAVGARHRARGGRLPGGQRPDPDLAARRLGRRDRPHRGPRRARLAAAGRRDGRPDGAVEGTGRQGPQRARVHGARGGHRHGGQPRRGPQDAVRLPRLDPSRGLLEGPRHRRRGLAAAVRPRRRQRARHGAGRLERRAAGAGRTTARRCRASTTASRSARRLYPNVHPGAASYGEVDPPREVLRTPAIGDIDGDMEPEIVDSGGEHVYAWEADGSTVSGFPVRIDPSLSRPQDRTRNNHIKRGFTRLARARGPERGRPARDRRSVPRPARVRMGRRRRPAARLPEEAAAIRPSRAPRSSRRPRSAT